MKRTIANVYHALFLMLLFSVSACQTQASKIEPGASLHQKEAFEIANVPKAVLNEIKKSHPKFKPLEAENELKHGNTYFDIEGLDSDGNEIEFDMLLQKDNSWKIAEIQRDLNVDQVPEPVLKAFKQRIPTLAPTRIIESDQGNGVIVYEFFTNDNNKEQKHEVKLTVDFLEKEWKH